MVDDEGRPEDVDELVEELLGPEWVHEDKVDQFTELIRRYGDPHEIRDQLDELIAQAEATDDSPPE